MNSYLEQAKELKNKFKTLEAIDLFKKAYDEDNNSIEAIANIGLCYMILGEITKAKEAFNKAKELDKTDELVQLYTAIIDVALGESTEELQLTSDNILASEQFMASSELLYEIGLKQEAFRLFEAVLAKIKDEHWLSLASNQVRIVSMLSRNGFFMEAQDIANSLLSANRESWQSYTALAMINLEQGNAKEAKDLFKKALQNGGEKEKIVISSISDPRLLEAF